MGLRIHSFEEVESATIYDIERSWDIARSSQDYFSKEDESEIEKFHLRKKQWVDVENVKDLKERLGFRLYGVVFGDERAVKEIELILDDLFDKLNKR